MRVPKAWVPLLAKKLVENSLAKALFKPAVPLEKLIFETEELILNELTVEDRLNEEVRELLRKHSSKIEQGHMDYRKLFELTKQKLVKERNLIL